MNNYLEWDKSYSSERRLARWEKEENKKLIMCILATAGIWIALFYLFLHVF